MITIHIIEIILFEYLLRRLNKELLTIIFDFLELENISYEFGLKILQI